MFSLVKRKTWMPGTRPGRTKEIWVAAVSNVRNHPFSDSNKKPAADFATGCFDPGIDGCSVTAT
jgi:hypothetical protein